jgi:Flp pilus assembly protein TadG
MIATYFILKITFQAILEEANRMAVEGENTERGRALKARIVQLDVDYDSGKMTEEEYGRRQMDILEELRRLSTQNVGGAQTG